MLDTYGECQVKDFSDQNKPNLPIKIRNVVTVGLVSMNGIGDSLQYCVMNKLINEVISDPNITFISPDAQAWHNVSEDLDMPACLINSNLNMRSIVKQFLTPNVAGRLPKRHLSKGQKTRTKTTKSKKLSVAKKPIKKIMENCYRSYSYTKYVAIPYLKKIHSINAPYAAGMVGGHTVCHNIDKYIAYYKAVRSVVPCGPIVTSPISISALSIKNNATLKRLKKSLAAFDHIFVRGSHTLKIIQDLDINTNVDVALDNGFGLKLLYPEVLNPDFSNKKSLRIIIIPRKQYFEHNDKMGLYKPYLESLVNFILWAFEKHDAEIYIALQIVNRRVAKKSSGIEDLIELFEKKKQNNQQMKQLNVFYPTNIKDAYEFYSSADLVVSSYMHGGIMHMAAGVPVVFIAPLTDVKIVDNLTTLNLNQNHFFIDMFDEKQLTPQNLIEKTSNIIENLRLL